MNNDDLKKMYEDASDNSDDKKHYYKKNPKKYIYISFVSIVVLLGIGGGGLYYLNSKDLNDESKKTTTSSQVDFADKELTKEQKETSEKQVKEKTEEVYKKSETPIKINDWAKIPYSEQSKNSDLRKNGLTYSDDVLFSGYTQILPSEENGYTSDVSKAENSDGTPNLNYSYETAEQVAYVYSMYMNRLLNPVFGSWNSLPYGVAGGAENNFPEEIFKDMFSDDWWTKNIKDTNHSSIPILADWKGDSWGGLDVEGKSLGIWYGEVKSINVITEQSKTGTGVDFIVDMNIEYTATLKDNKKAKKEGTMKLKLIPNVNNTNPENRVVIDEVTFSVQNKE